jgi:hypothetical protein
LIPFLFTTRYFWYIYKTTDWNHHIISTTDGQFLIDMYHKITNGGGRGWGSIYKVTTHYFWCTKQLTEIGAIAVFPVFRLLTDFVCLFTYEFCLSLWKIVRCSVILLLPLSSHISTTDCTISYIYMYLKITNWGGEGEVGVNIYSHHSLLLMYKTTYWNHHILALLMDNFL